MKLGLGILMCWCMLLVRKFRKDTKQNEEIESLANRVREMLKTSSLASTEMKKHNDQHGLVIQRSVSQDSTLITMSFDFRADSCPLELLPYLREYNVCVYRPGNWQPHLGRNRVIVDGVCARTVIRIPSEQCGQLIFRFSNRMKELTEKDFELDFTLA